MLSMLLALLPPAAQHSLFPNPRIDFSDTQGVADLDGDGRSDIYADSEITLLQGAFDIKQIIDHPVISQDAVHTDFDADGDLDLAVVGQSGIFLRPNLGGSFGFKEWDSGPMVTAVDAGDLDGDGLIDLAASRAGASYAQAYLGDGADDYTSFVLTELGLKPRDQVLADVDQDGMLDFVANVSEGGLAVALSTGSGAFGPPSQQHAALSLRAIATADFDADGIADVAAAGGGLGYVFRGDGAGAFGPPATFDAPGPAAFTLTSASVAVLDFDGAGGPDVAVTATGGGIPLQELALSIGHGDGSGGIAGVEHLPLVGSYGIGGFGDFDGDGDLDLAGRFESSTVFFERVGGGFVAPTPVLAGTSIMDNLGLGDLDGDGDADLTVTASGGTTLGFNDGSGGFAFSPAPPDSIVDKNALVSDLAGDGVADLVLFSNTSTAPKVSIHSSDGQGGFLPELLEPLEDGHMLADGEGNRSYELADWTGDGRPDLWLPGGGIFLFPGLADRTFGPPTFSVILGGYQLANSRPSPVDLDLDGMLDAAWVKSNGDLKVYLQTVRGNGAGAFTQLQSFFLDAILKDDHVAAADFDLDGWPDVVSCATRSYTGVGGGLLQSHGKLYHVPGTSPWLAYEMGSLVTADVNGDGARDVVAQDGHVMLAGPDGLSQPRGYYSEAISIAVGDVDGGGLDLILEHDQLDIVLLSNASPCEGRFEGYGGGCPGTGGLVPVLTGSGCPTPGGVFQLDVAHGLSGTIAYASFGLGAGALALPNGCDLLLNPWIPIFVPFVLAADGTGSLAIGISPEHQPGLKSTAQVGLFDPGVPGYFTLTNGLWIFVQ